MAVDRNAVIKLYKSGKSNIEIAKRLYMKRSKIVRKFQKTGNTLDRPGLRKNGVSAPLNSSKIRGKSCDETLAEAAKPWPPQPV